MVYFDQSATTMPYNEILDTYIEVSKGYYGNPSSLHTLGQQAESLIRKSAQQVGKLLGVDEKEIIFTSGGSESNNMALKGVASHYKNRGNHMITTCIEHPSILNVCKQLEMEGINVTYLPVNSEGIVDVEELIQSITPQTILVSIQHVNNELGSIQPIEEIGGRLKRYNRILFHVDGVQGIGKVPLDLKKAHIDMYSLSGHKFHSVKGSGMLYVRNGVTLSPLISGGSQQGSIRAGTENLPAIVCFAKALRLTLEKQESAILYLRGLNSQIRPFLEALDGVQINTPRNYSAPHILNFSVQNTRPEVVIQELSKHGIYISSRSACSSKKKDVSHVLLAMGFSEERASTALRISFSATNTQEEVDQFMDVFPKEIQQIQKVMRFK